jgi:hypothetical protein
MKTQIQFSTKTLMLITAVIMLVIAILPFPQSENDLTGTAVGRPVSVITRRGKAAAHFYECAGRVNDEPARIIFLARSTSRLSGLPVAYNSQRVSRIITFPECDSVVINGTEYAPVDGEFRIVVIDGLSAPVVATVAENDFRQLCDPWTLQFHADDSLVEFWNDVLRRKYRLRISKIE